MSNLSKDVLNTVKRRTGKSISPKEIQNVASGVDASTLRNEQELRALIKQVAKMAGVPVAESTIKELITAIKKSGMNPSNMENMVKMMLGKK